MSFSKDGRNGKRMKKKIICSILSACTALSMTACATGYPAGASGLQDKETEKVSEESDAAIGGAATDLSDVNIAPPGEGFAFEGTYTSDRCRITFTKGADKTVNVKIGWSSSFNESVEWTMSGEYDSEAYSIKYENCVKKDVVYKAENEIDKEETLYTDGTGTFLFSLSGDSVTWTDKKEDVAQGKIFQIQKGESETVTSGSSSGDANFYDSFTAMDKVSLERIALDVKKAYLAEDWDSLKSLVRYPIEICGVSIEDEASFVKYMKDKKVTPEDRKAMEDEDCCDMFTNGQGLCMGVGEVWLLDTSYFTDKTPEIKIISINGVK